MIQFFFFHSLCKAQIHCYFDSTGQFSVPRNIFIFFFCHNKNMPFDCFSLLSQHSYFDLVYLYTYKEPFNVIILAEWTMIRWVYKQITELTSLCYVIFFLLAYNLNIQLFCLFVTKHTENERTRKNRWSRGVKRCTETVLFNVNELKIQKRQKNKKMLLKKNIIGSNRKTTNFCRILRK